MECLISLFETLFDKGTKDPVFLVPAIEESADMTLAAKAASGKLRGMTLGCHISPHLSIEKRRNGDCGGGPYAYGDPTEEKGVTTGNISRKYTGDTSAAHKHVKP